MSFLPSLKAEEIQAHYARRRKRGGHAYTAVLLDNATSPVATSRVFLYISNADLGDLSMNPVLRQVGQAMHEANDLLTPPMHPWHFRQFPGTDWTMNTKAQRNDHLLSMAFINGLSRNDKKEQSLQVAKCVFS